MTAATYNDITLSWRNTGMCSG